MREICITYSKSRALQQICDSFVSETSYLSDFWRGLTYILILPEVEVELVRILMHPVWNGPYNCQLSVSHYYKAQSKGSIAVNSTWGIMCLLHFLKSIAITTNTGCTTRNNYTGKYLAVVLYMLTSFVPSCPHAPSSMSECACLCECTSVCV